MEEKSKEVIRNLYENYDRRGKVEVDESLKKVKHYNLRRHNGEKIKGWTKWKLQKNKKKY